MQPKLSSWRNTRVRCLACIAIAVMLWGSRSPAVQSQEASSGRTIDQPGTVVAFEQADVYARITGYVKKVNVDIGDSVKSGDVLAELGAPELEQKFNLCKAQVLRAQAGILRAKVAAGLAAKAQARAEAVVKEAEAGQQKAATDLERWKAEFERARKILQKGGNDQIDVKETENNLKAAEAAMQQASARFKLAEAMLDEANAQPEKANAEVTCAEADLAVAKAEAAQVSALLQFAAVRAPFDGVVDQRFAARGMLAGPSAGGRAEPLFTVARVDSVHVVVEIPELDSVLVVKGMPATIHFQAFAGKEFKGTVTRTAAALDPKARTLRVEIDLKNSDRQLRPGMYANVSLKPNT